MNKTLLAGLALFATAALCPAEDAPAPPKVTPSPKGAKLYIIAPKDGKTVKAGKVTIKFGLKGMGVCPAGLYLEHTGHHHLLINMDAKELDQSLPIPTIEGKCLHYGKGQTEVTLELPKGKHTLQLILGNYAHIVHDPPMISEKITITVE